MDKRGQTSLGGAIVVLLIVSVGAVVFFQITGSIFSTVSGGTASVENTGTGTIEVKSNPSSASLSCSYNFTSSALLTITLNGQVIENKSYTGSGTFENDVLSYVSKGSNSFTVAVDNEERISSLTTTLDIDTYAGSAISATESTGSTVFQLATIFALVVIASAIIGVILNAFRGGREKTIPTPT